VHAGLLGVVLKLPDMLRTESEHTLAVVRHRLDRNVAASYAKLT
jgi:hypothetical protein